MTYIVKYFLTFFLKVHFSNNQPDNSPESLGFIFETFGFELGKYIKILNEKAKS